MRHYRRKHGDIIGASKSKSQEASADHDTDDDNEQGRESQ
jgi:hypothetical protein